MPGAAAWPMIILRTPKGWTGPKEVDGHKLEGSWRAHQIPITDPVTNPAHLKMVEAWMRSYKPEELFDESGRLIAELKEMAPAGRGGSRRIRMRMAGCCASRWRCRTSATMR
jgi:xylulose-5-phosphate/fructose-6-phosphate phosphoketolase